MEKHQLIIDGHQLACIVELVQNFTYAGITESPSVGLHRRIIDQVTQAAEYQFAVPKVVVIPPFSLLDDEAAVSLFPDITCMAMLSVDAPRTVPHIDHFLLAVVWWQKQYAFPIDAQVLDAIKEIKIILHGIPVPFEYVSAQIESEKQLQ